MANYKSKAWLRFCGDNKEEWDGKLDNSVLENSRK